MARIDKRQALSANRSRACHDIVTPESAIDGVFGIRGWGSALYHNPRLYTVQITATRPADGAEASSQWSNNTPPGSYGDMLSTVAGCVRVSAVVITPRGTGPAATTTCLK